MTAAAVAFAERAGLGLTHDQCSRLGASFVGEWSRHFAPVPGVVDMVRRLADSYRIGVVSNTHDPTMVPDLLTAMGLADTIDTIVSSVEHGYSKPHPSIYRTAIERIGARPAEVAFVGDSYEADFVGPQEAGMCGFLIGLSRDHRIPTDRRLRGVLDIETRLRGGDAPA